MDLPDNDFSPMMQEATIYHEAYSCLVAVGFSEEQAMYLLGQMIVAGIQSHG